MRGAPLRDATHSRARTKSGGRVHGRRHAHATTSKQASERSLTRQAGKRARTSTVTAAQSAMTKRSNASSTIWHRQLSPK
eukprot:6083172-Alexandrium_andersonii.AAC.1